MRGPVRRPIAIRVATTLIDTTTVVRIEGTPIVIVRRDTTITRLHIGHCEAVGDIVYEQVVGGAPRHDAVTYRIGSR